METVQYQLACGVYIYIYMYIQKQQLNWLQPLPALKPNYASADSQQGVCFVQYILSSHLQTIMRGEKR